jgi:hypothetical protein
MKMRSWKVKTSRRTAGALWETEAKAMRRRKGTALNPGQGRERERGMDDISAGNL